MEYRLTVGLEVHAELKTRTKMFCACLNNPDEETPNKNICPVCMAHPGTLPVINKEAVRKVLLVGAAVNARIADFTEFDRKNYFYPDIPKDYQISQDKYPLISGGILADIAITRIHLEEDTARSQHIGEKSLVDFNRAGVPLMELVTEPVIHSAEAAGRFARELQLLLRVLGAGEANMEKGEMRVEANISIAPVRSAIEINQESKPVLGTKVEVKNLNSFRSVERAIQYEIERQSKLLDSGEAVVQETRGWDENKQVTFSQRKKESSHDYRYFPDPDLPKLKVSEIPEFAENLLRKELPELPWIKRERYLALGLKKDDAEMFVTQQAAGFLFETAINNIPNGDPRIALTANYVANDLAGKWLDVEPAALAVLVEFKVADKISSRGAKDALAEAISTGGDLKVIVGKYLQQNDSALLGEIAAKVIASNPQVAADYKAGKEAAMQFLVGQGMKESRGSANPAQLREEIIKALS